MLYNEEQFKRDVQVECDRITAMIKDEADTAKEELDIVAVSVGALTYECAVTRAILNTVIHNGLKERRTGGK